MNYIYVGGNCKKMMKKILKYIPTTDNGIYLSIAGVVFILFFIPTMFYTNDIQTALITASIGGTAAYIFSFLNDNLGRKKHASIVNGKTFRRIRDELNFKVENRNSYWGLKGIYNNYFFRIYYDWNTSLPGKGAYNEVCIMLYFEPLLTTKGSINIKLLEDLNKIYNKRSRLKSYQILIETSHIRVHTYIRTYKEIVNKMNAAIEIAKKENFIPITEDKVNFLIKQDKYLNGPGIETFE